MTRRAKRALLGLLTALSSVGCASAGGNRAVASRAFAEILDGGRYELVPELYAPDFRNHGISRDATLAEDMEALRTLRDALPGDAHVKAELIVAEGDYVSVLWKVGGTFVTGDKAFRGITIWKVVDGRIQEEWSEFDERGLLQALGIMPGG